MRVELILVQILSLMPLPIGLRGSKYRRRDLNPQSTDSKSMSDSNLLTPAKHVSLYQSLTLEPGNYRFKYAIEADRGIEPLFPEYKTDVIAAILIRRDYTMYQSSESASVGEIIHIVTSPVAVYI